MSENDNTNDKDSGEDKKKDEVFLSFCYIGQDLSFWNKLQKRITKTYDDKKVTFINIDIENGSNEANPTPTALFYKLIHTSTDILFIDYSKSKDLLLKLAKIIRNDNKSKLISTVGLFDYQLGPLDISRSLLSGVRINHFKGDELSSIIYQSVAFFDPSKAIEFKFALAKVNVAHTLRQDLRMIYIEDDKIRIETNSPLTEKTEITLIKPKEDTKSSHHMVFTIESIKDYNLYYNSRYGAILKAKDANDIKSFSSKKDKNTSPKFLKIAFFDKNLEILKENDFDISKLNYSFNFQTMIHHDHLVVKRQRPNLIIIQLDEFDITIEIVKELTQTIKALSNYIPYIFIFNYKQGETISKVVNYPKLLSFPTPFTWPIVENIAKKLTEKTPEKLTKRHFFSSKNPDVIVKIEHNVNVLGFDEQNLYFEYLEELPMYTVFSMIYPVKLLLTIVPIQEGSEFSSNKNAYKGLINLVSESKFQKLRFEINEIFFEEKKQQKEENKRIRIELEKKYQEELLQTKKEDAKAKELKEKEDKENKENKR